MFQRLCIHVIQRLRPVHAHLYLQPGMEDGYGPLPILSLVLFSKPVEVCSTTSWCICKFSLLHRSRQGLPLFIYHSVLWAICLQKVFFFGYTQSLKHSFLCSALMTWMAQWRTLEVGPVLLALSRLSCPSWSMALSHTASIWPSTLLFSTSLPKWERKRLV